MSELARWDAARKAVEGRSRRGPALPQDARIAVHFHPEAGRGGSSVLLRILQERRYVSQFVTGTSNGGLTAYPGGQRWEWESRLFGGAYDDAPAVGRPVYGALMLHGDPYGPAARFGSAYLRLNPAVLTRTSFAWPDSALGPTAFGVPGAMAVLDDFLAARSEDPLNHYIEAHLHGELRLPKDVEAVVLDPTFDDCATLALAEELGVRVERHPGYRASVAELEAHPDYRGAEVVALARRVAAEATVTPRELARARATGEHRPQDLKRLWHCLARFGRRPT